MTQPATAEKIFWGRMALSMVVLTVVLAFGFVAVGCSTSNSDSVTTSSTVAAEKSGSTGTSAPTRLVVGGKTAEEYAAQIPDLQKAVDANPSDLTALQNLAVAQYNSGKYDEAAATYDKMLKLKDDPTVHNNYGNVLRDEKKLDEAQTQYRAAIAGDPSLVAPYINLAQILAADKNISEAEKVLDQGVAHTAGEDKQRLQDYKATISGAK